MWSSPHPHLTMEAIMTGTFLLCLFLFVPIVSASSNEHQYQPRGKTSLNPNLPPSWTPFPDNTAPSPALDIISPAFSSAAAAVAALEGSFAPTTTLSQTVVAVALEEAEMQSKWFHFASTCFNISCDPPDACADSSSYCNGFRNFKVNLPLAVGSVVIETLTKLDSYFENYILTNVSTPDNRQVVQCADGTQVNITRNYNTATLFSPICYEIVVNNWDSCNANGLNGVWNQTQCKDVLAASARNTVQLATQSCQNYGGYNRTVDDIVQSEAPSACNHTSDSSSTSNIINVPTGDERLYPPLPTPSPSVTPSPSSSATPLATTSLLTTLTSSYMTQSPSLTETTTTSQMLSSSPSPAKSSSTKISSTWSRLLSALILVFGLATI